MSLFCSISSVQPLHPVVSPAGNVYERDLVVKYLRENDGKDPITGDQLAEDQLVEIKTGECESLSLSGGLAERGASEVDLDTQGRHACSVQGLVLQSKTD